MEIGKYEKTDYGKIVQVVKAILYNNGKKENEAYAKNTYEEIDIIELCNIIDTSVETIDQALDDIANRLINLDIDRAIKAPGINFREAFDRVAADIKYATQYEKQGGRNQEPDCYLTTARLKEYKQKVINVYNTKQRKYNEQFENNMHVEYNNTFNNEDWKNVTIEYESENGWEIKKGDSNAK